MAGGRQDKRDRDVTGYVVHPNSIRGRTKRTRDTVTERRIHEGRNRMNEDLKSFETWARGDCMSGIEVLG